MSTVEANAVSTLGSHPPPVAVTPLSGWRDRDVFVRFPWQIYDGDPAWSPPLLLERKEFINPRKHPFYRHGTAQLFLARRAGKVVGRILASDDPNYNREHGANTGCFGMFESIDDSAVAHAMLETVANWLRARGRTHILGPVDYSTNYPCGLLVDGFETPPRVMMNHNPRYYAGLLESWGLTKVKDLYSWWFGDYEALRRKWSRLGQRLSDRGTITVRPFRREDWNAEVRRCKNIYNQAWERNWGFVRMTDAEFDHLAKDLRRWVQPEMVLLAEVAGQAVGFAITLPDFNEAFRPLDGRLFKWGLPIGMWRLARGLRKIKTGRLMALGVLAEYRRRGVAELLILNTMENGVRLARYDAAELSWTLEDNESINTTIRAVGAEQYKTYRIYERSI